MGPTDRPRDAVLDRFEAARVAVLGTTDRAAGPPAAPHLVPVTFALAAAVGGGAGEAVAPLVLSAVDGKPKRGPALRRLENIAAHPAVSLLVQHWEEDWDRLWWIRADGRAEISNDPGVLDRATTLLRAKYPQYGSIAVAGPVLVIALESWRSWSATPGGP